MKPSIALRRCAPALAVPLLALVLASPTTAATPTAEHSDRPAVTGADLPKTSRVANTFRYLSGGSRFTYRARALEYTDASTCTGSKGVKVESGRFASYVTRSGDSPYLQGREEPTFAVYEFSDATAARKGMRRITTYARLCRGTVADGELTTTVSRFLAPALGRTQVGYRSTFDDGEFRYQWAEIYVQRGKRIERSWIQVEKGRASQKRVSQMARVLADVAR